MKQKLLGSFLGAYLFFIISCFLAALYFTPKLLRKYLYQISEEEAYRNYLSSQFVAIQNVCYALLLILLVASLIPTLVFWFRIYRPLNRIILAAALYTDSASHSPIQYEKDDELGLLTASINYLADEVYNAEVYQRKFISNISHDFRSPLTSIKGYIEAMLDGTIPPEMQEKYLRVVLSETERLNKLTQSLLTLNTFDDRGNYLEMSDFDLIPVIRNVVTLFERLSQGKDLQIQCTFSESRIMVHADLGKIQQVLYNLLDNAIKFSYTGGLIHIDTSVQKNLVYVSVKDHGEGISSENLPKIWDRFFKTDASRGRDKKGTGLGLSIVKDIIRAHNQNITAVSTEGAGTEFIFTLDKASKNNL